MFITGHKGGIMGKTSKRGFVYLMQAKGTNSYKIGLSTDPGRRLKQLNSGQAPQPIDMIFKFLVGDMSKAEKYLHNHFSSRRGHGEWFTFKDSEILEVRSAFEKASRLHPIHVAEERKIERTPQIARPIRRTEKTTCQPIDRKIKRIETARNAVKPIPRRVKPDEQNSIVMFAVAGLLACLIGVSAHKAANRKEMISVPEPFNAAIVYDSPSGEKIDTIPNGSKVELIDSDRDWCHLEYESSRKGWVQCSVLHSLSE